MSTQIELLKKHGLSVRGHVGQHLLVDPNIQRKIVDLLNLKAGEKVLEIGPGLGALTGEILKRGARLWVVEKDRQFVSILGEEYKDYIESKRLGIFEEDFLKFDFQKVPASKKGKIKVIGNLPYYITAPVLFYLLDHRGRISEAVLTMQKEVAARLTASPGSKDYGRLTLAVRYRASVRHHFDIPPACFTPKPEVFSSVVSLKFHTGPKPLKSSEEKRLLELIRLAFSQRRKTLAHLLAHYFKGRVKKEEVIKRLESVNLSPTVRGEELLLKDYLALVKEFRFLFARHFEPARNDYRWAGEKSRR